MPARREAPRESKSKKNVSGALPSHAHSYFILGF